MPRVILAAIVLALISLMFLTVRFLAPVCYAAGDSGACKPGVVTTYKSPA